MTNHRGDPTGAVYTFMQQMRRLQKDLAPTHFAVMMDENLDSVLRRQQLPLYKSERVGKCPPELIEQFPKAREALEAFGIPWKSKVGYEADDLIATYAWEARGCSDVSIVSHDKDMLQLVDDRIVVVNHRNDEKQKVMDRNRVRERWGVYPEQMGDLLALSGDSSDSIPGVPGIGYKKAAALLQHYKNLDGVLRTARKGEIQVRGIGRKLARNLSDFASQAEEMRKIVQLQRVPEMNEHDWTTDFEIAKRNQQWLDRATKFCERENMQWLIQQLRDEHQEAMESGSFSETNAAQRMFYPKASKRSKAASGKGCAGATEAADAAPKEQDKAEQVSGEPAKQASAACSTSSAGTKAWHAFLREKKDAAKSELEADAKPGEKVDGKDVQKLVSVWWNRAKAASASEAKKQPTAPQQLLDEPADQDSFEKEEDEPEEKSEEEESALQADEASGAGCSAARTRKKTAWNLFYREQLVAAKQELESRTPGGKASIQDVNRLLAQKWHALKKSSSSEAKEELQALERRAEELVRQDDAAGAGDEASAPPAARPSSTGGAQKADRS